ncbi:MAG: TolC family protein [Tannerellaceae bacterium]|jgi:outer membrane protein TolC|nr:TolC family protein [Tannerellaceae bacterium]
MKTFMIVLCIMGANLALFAQENINSALASIEENNATLKALRETAEAQKLENKAGTYLPGPEADFNYLWGNPSIIGNRTDFSVSQTFDIPAITGMRSRVAQAKNHLEDRQYRTDRMSILLEAKQYCIEMVYYNALMKELLIRLQHAQTIAEGYKERLDKGDAGILEYNKAYLNLSTVQGEISRVEVERNALLLQLKRLNGGMDLALPDTEYSEPDLPADFDEWFLQAEDKNPALAYVKQEVEVSKRQLSLSKAMGWPSLSTGYMSESVVGQRYGGVSLGISIPLWGNKNRVRQAKASVVAAQSRQADGRQQLYSRLRILYDRVSGLKATAGNYRSSLANVNSTDLLRKALDAGQISLLEYMVEMGLYYDTVNRILEAERDYRKAYAELSSAEL